MTTSSKSAPCVLWGLGTSQPSAFSESARLRGRRPGPRRLLRSALSPPQRLSAASASPSASPSSTSGSTTSASASPTATPSASTASASSLGDHQLVLDSPAALGDPGALADLPAQVVELRAADVAARCDLELLDLRRVEREGPLDADSEGVLADGEGLAGAAALALDHDALEHLGPAAVALDHLEVDPHAVAGAELGALLENALLEALDDCAHGALGAGVRFEGAP